MRIETGFSKTAPHAFIRAKVFAISAGEVLWVTMMTGAASAFVLVLPHPVNGDSGIAQNRRDHCENARFVLQGHAQIEWSQKIGASRIGTD